MSKLLRTAGALALVIASSSVANGQTANAIGRVVVRVTADSLPIAGAMVASGTANSPTDRLGLATFTLPMGRRTFRVSSAGFFPESLALNVGAGMTRVSVALRKESSAPSDRTVAMRDVRRGADEATNVEVTDRFAMDEQVERSPGSVSELLNHVEGVRVQPLSAGSAGADVRIRGMPGHYTKILADGLPLYGASTEGLEFLQTPALGVERVEVVKGVSSAIYGPSAIAGIVNVISAPTTSPSELLVNGSTREASDVALFQTHTFTPRWSASIVAGRHYANPGDPDADGWAEIAGYKRIVVRPRVYWARDDRSIWFMTGGWTSENRRSGTFGDARLPDFNKYSDDADTRRGDIGTVGRITLDTTMYLTVRASLTREWRTRWFGHDREANRRNTIFGDVALTKSLPQHLLTGGVGFERDQFAALDDREFSYRYTTPALYGEDTWTPDPRLAVTAGARLDLHSEYGDFVSPRIAVVVHPSDAWTARLSAANGVYAPTPLTDETEMFGLSHVRRSNREAEHATGWSLDASHVDGALELRGAAYRTVISHPLILRTLGEELQLVNADEATRLMGLDVSARYRLRPLRLTATYSYMDGNRPEIGQLFGEDFEVDTTMRRPMLLNPRHSATVELAHERENDRVIGVSARFVGREELRDTLYTGSRPYVTLDARLEKHVGPTTVFAVAKNVTGVKQSQFFPVLLTASGPAGQWTRDAWGPLDGFALNVGLRLKY
ncbi:MAG TPA: TonB-dependent receptor [Gemmatimonadaceae bacterium]|nr:TonB-dependent receptor [Gemmatimonadaceae bacterium]